MPAADRRLDVLIEGGGITMTDLIEATHVRMTWGKEYPIALVVTIDDYLAMTADDLAGSLVQLLSRAEATVEMARQMARAC